MLKANIEANETVNMSDDKLTEFLREFETLTKNPEKYLSLQENEAKKVNLLTKNLYDFAKQYEDFKKKTGALNELIINRLDEEQIWQQIELQNNAVYDNVVSSSAHLLANKSKLKFPLKEKKKKSKIQSKQEAEDEEEEEDENVNNGSVMEETMEAKGNKEKKESNKKKSKKSSIVDDKFFKLHEMNAFLEEMEKEKEESDNEDLDYFDDNSSEDSNNSSYRPHYNDFFDQPDADEMSARENKRLHSDDDEDDDENENTKKAKKVKFSLQDRNESEENDSSKEEGEDAESENEVDDDEDNSYGEEEEEDEDEEAESDDLVLNKNAEVDNEEENESENDDDDDDSSQKSKNEKNNTEQQSTFEARQERLQYRINALEEAALKKKPWQMMGEVTGSSRPQNSLLQEYVEFDVATRPAPILTEKSTMKLEDIILQRIKDKAWDDVVRKIKPVDSEIEYKKQLVLNQEKSKLSLAQIYEQEYLQQLENKTQDAIEKPEIESREHQEIRIMMNKLFTKLDILSNFHFTPKQVAPEVKIVSNLPAISMEEVAPTATSDAALLAPEEIKAKLKGDLIGKSERTSTDKKRERRQKKLRQKLKHGKLASKVDAKLDEDKSKSSKNKISNKMLQRIMKSSNVTQLQQSGGKNIMSSTAFFSKLQDEGRSKMKKKSFDPSKPKLDKKFKASGKKFR